MADPTEKSSERDHSPRGAVDGQPLGDEAELLPPAILAKLPDFALEIYMRVRPTGGSMSTVGEKLRYVELVTERAMQAAIEALCLGLAIHRMQEAAEVVSDAQRGIASGQVSELLKSLFQNEGKRP